MNDGPQDSDPTADPDVTALLHQWSSKGDRHSLDLLMPVISRELHRIAQSFFAQERADHTLQPTALVNEVYLRLIDRRRATWQDRVHFLSFAARTMRRILVDHARKRFAAKRGAGIQLVPLVDSSAQAHQRSVDLLSLDEALSRLAELDPRQGQIVELRYFAGLTIPEIATVVDLGPATVNRDLAMARAWLRRELEADGEA
jgi:RNA polymerase sigma factor (TIGR02999 family)